MVHVAGPLVENGPSPVSDAVPATLSSHVQLAADAGPAAPASSATVPAAAAIRIATKRRIKQPGQLVGRGKCDGGFPPKELGPAAVKQLPGPSRRALGS